MAGGLNLNVEAKGMAQSAQDHEGAAYHEQVPREVGQRDGLDNGVLCQRIHIAFWERPALKTSQTLEAG
jgi:hypothetical protein